MWPLKFTSSSELEPQMPSKCKRPLAPSSLQLPRHFELMPLPPHHRMLVQKYLHICNLQEIDSRTFPDFYNGRYRSTRRATVSTCGVLRRYVIFFLPRYPKPWTRSEYLLILNGIVCSLPPEVRYPNLREIRPNLRS